jgi:deazaflavin-dependent oxidoreductase (nitroreductase family)
MDRPRHLDHPLVKPLLKRAAAANVWLYRKSGGRLGGRFPGGAPVLVLEHVGRASGRRLTTPLLYLRDGADVVVVASSGGMKDDPQWLRNLRATPEASVQVGRDVRPVRARVAGVAERARLWPRLVDMYSGYASYDEWTDREIPVVVLEPR